MMTAEPALVHVAFFGMRPKTLEPQRLRQLPEILRTRSAGVDDGG
jgi:hypothetical protein